MKYLYLKILAVIDHYHTLLKVFKLRKQGVLWKKPNLINCYNNISFGCNVYIGPGAEFMAKGNILIGSNVRIGPNCCIWTENHNYKSTTHLPYDYDDILKEVVVEDNVWIGMNVTIAPGVRIKEGSVIALGSVITKDVEAGSIMGGNPAKSISMRDMELYHSLKENKKFHII